MARTLSLLCIIAMMSSAQTQHYYRQRESETGYPITNAYKNPQSRNLQYTIPPILENLYARYPENMARTNRAEKREKLQEAPRVDNGTYKFLNRLQVNKRGALEESVVDDNDRVVFPGPTSNSRHIKLIIPEECQRQGYCEDVPNHPVELVEKAVQRLGERVKSLQMDSYPTDEENISIVQRLGGEKDTEIQLCDSKTTVIHPESAVDKNGVWYTVLNLKDKPVQGFLAEVCKNSNSQKCNSLATFPASYTSSCVQKHVYRVMEALDSSGKQVQVPLKLPSCCSCILNKSGA